MDLVEVGSRTMQVRCIYVGFGNTRLITRKKNAEKNRSAVHGMYTARRNPVAIPDRDQSFCGMRRSSDLLIDPSHALFLEPNCL